jgi:hypothetical protein
MKLYPHRYQNSWQARYQQSQWQQLSHCLLSPPDRHQTHPTLRQSKVENDNIKYQTISNHTSYQQRVNDNSLSPLVRHETSIYARPGYQQSQWQQLSPCLLSPHDRHETQPPSISKQFAVTASYTLSRQQLTEQPRPSSYKTKQTKQWSSTSPFSSPTLPRSLLRVVCCVPNVPEAP